MMEDSEEHFGQMADPGWNRSKPPAGKSCLCCCAKHGLKLARVFARRDPNFRSHPGAGKNTFARVWLAIDPAISTCFIAWMASLPTRCPLQSSPSIKTVRGS